MVVGCVTDLLYELAASILSVTQLTTTQGQNPRSEITLTTTLFRVDGITHITEVINNKARNQSLP